MRESPSQRAVHGHSLPRVITSYSIHYTKLYEGISRRYAEKNRIPQAEVLAMWDEKARIARERGTLVHSRAERAILHFIEHGDHIDLNEILTDEHSDGVSDDPWHTRRLITSMHQAVVKMSRVLDFVCPERVIASPHLGLSGMVDLTVKLP